MGVGKSTFTFTNSSITIDGGSTTINITRDNQSYSHKLRHGFGDIATLAVGTTSYTWKPTAAQLTKFWEEVPNQRTRQIGVTLDTYNGSTLVGSDYHTLTVQLSLPTGRPSINSYTVTDTNTIAKNMGIWVYGKSSGSESVNTTYKYGSANKNTHYSYEAPSMGYDNAISALNSAASTATDPVQISLSCTVSDTRSFWSEQKTNAYYVAKYIKPHIDTFEVLRCDTSGTKDDNGTKAKVTLKGGWAAMKVETAYKNTATLKVGYRVAGSTSAYTFQSISVSAGTANVSQLLSATLDANTDYEFSVILSDAFSESDSKSEVPFINSGNILYVSPDGTEMTLGLPSGHHIFIQPTEVDVLTPSNSNIIAAFSESSGIIDLRYPTDAQSLTAATNYTGLTANCISSSASCRMRAGSDSSSVYSYFDVKSNGVATIKASSKIVFTGPSVLSNSRSVENLMWMYCMSTTATGTESLANGWNAINCTALLNGTGSSANYFTMGSNGLITFKKAGYYRIKLNVFGYSANKFIGAGIFNGSTEEFSAFSYSYTDPVTVSCEGFIKVSANSTRTLKCGGWVSTSGAKWTLYQNKAQTNLLIQYVGV